MSGSHGTEACGMIGIESAAVAMAEPTPGTAPQPYLVVADGPGWPHLSGLPLASVDDAPAHLRAAAAAGRPVQVVLYRPVLFPGGEAEIGRLVRGLWTADPRVQVVLALPDVDGCWADVRGHLRPGDALVPVPLAAVTGPAVAQLADALSAKWAAAANAIATAAEVDRRVADRTADLSRLAMHDRLTGLANRALLNDRLTDLLAAAAADPARAFAVLFLDFDRFKIVNDSLGHEIGDGLLIAIADRLRRTLRESDTVSTGIADAAAVVPQKTTAARLGGDEFILLLDGLRDPVDAVRVAERVLANLAAPYRIGGHLIHSTASIGITTSGIGYASAADMVRDADTAMYRAKAAGKARYVLFDRRMHDEAVDRLSLETDLRHALDRLAFAVQYQPIVRLDADAPAVIGFEVLLRWNHPTRGPVPPAVFVPLAEEVGGMDRLGEWVIDTACRQLATWRAAHPGPFADLSVHLNLSRRQLSAPGFAAYVAVALAEHGVPAPRLHLEFTERALADDPAAAAAVLEQLRSRGVELHLDNFGTGQSSLSCLHRYPLSGLKVGGNFTRDALTRPADRTVLAAVVGLARDLDLHLVAEGIETPEQVALLRQLGCDRAQGYHFARALDAADAEAFVLGRR